MRIVDVNVLVYAVNADAPHHREARSWIDSSLSGGARLGFSWFAVMGFARIVTVRGILPHPLSVDEALDQVDAWLAAPTAVVVEPTARHASLVRELLRGAGAGGNLVNDAHLAALAVEHRGVVVSYDSDFGRFPGLRWERPGS